MDKNDEAFKLPNEQVRKHQHEGVSVPFTGKYLEYKTYNTSILFL